MEKQTIPNAMEIKVFEPPSQQDGSILDVKKVEPEHNNNVQSAQVQELTTDRSVEVLKI